MGLGVWLGGGLGVGLGGWLGAGLGAVLGGWLGVWLGVWFGVGLGGGLVRGLGEFGNAPSIPRVLMCLLLLGIVGGTWAGYLLRRLSQHANMLVTACAWAAGVVCASCLL